MIENEFLNYRDPLTGVIFIVTLVFLASFITYTLSIYKEKLARKEYKRLLKRFELGNLKEEDYIHLYSTYNLPFDSIILLASSFIHKGKYDKAISVYLTLLEHVKEPVKKQELLELLGNAYFKSGMLQRSKDIYLKILKFSPRHKLALKSLLLIFESLKEYDKVQEVLESLDELEEDTYKEKIYLNAQLIINDPFLSYEKKSTLLLQHYKKDNQIERLVVNYLTKYSKVLLWENINSFNLLNNIDILWYLDFDDIQWDSVQENQTLKEIYSAKGYIADLTQSKSFELQTLIAVKNSPVKSDIDLNFEFICTQCKKTHPVYEPRCPHCHTPLSFKVEPKLGKPTANLASLV
jgi:tetratricopeptide (TPR) repeat protein